MGARDDKVQIKLVMMSGNEPAFVEYWDVAKSRYTIINAKTFTDVFGISTEELRAFNLNNKVRRNK